MAEVKKYIAIDHRQGAALPVSVSIVGALILA